MRKLSFLVTIVLASTITVFAQTADPVAKGAAWLNAHQNPNGTWGVLPDLLPRDTARALIALQLNRSASTSVAVGTAWLASQQSFSSNQFLAEQALALALAGRNSDAFLATLASRHAPTTPDFGGFETFNGNNYDSALALQALSARESTYASTAAGIVSTLTGRQNADGGWGFDGGFESNPIFTSEILIALTNLKTVQPPAAAVAAAQTYLSRLVGPDGSVRGNVLETALAFRSLALSGFRIGSLAAQPLTYLGTAQQTDGSWNADAYITARVLDAFAANKPNYAVTNFQLTPGTAAEGSSITATARITNTGIVAAAATTLTIYIGDATGRVLGSSNVSALIAGGDQNVTVTFTASQLVGTQTLLAMVDPTGATDELREEDNRATATLTITGKPDFQVYGSSITTTPSRLQPGQTGQLSVTIRNGGEGDATNVGYAIYDVVAGATTLLKKDALPSLKAGDAQLVSIPVVLEAGAHTIRVVADPDNLLTESNESNNTAEKAIAVSSVANVDLRIDSRSMNVAPARPSAGTPITITAIVENTGTDPVESTVAFFDGVPGNGGIVIGGQRVAIDAQSYTALRATYTTTDSTKVLYAVADPDSLLPEMDEQNNSGFVALTDQYADLAITTDGVVVPRVPPSSGQSVTTRVVVRNLGLLPATAAEVVIYDDLPSRGGVEVKRAVVDVPANGKAVVSATFIARYGQRFATATVNAAHAIFEPTYTNNRATKYYVVHGSGSDTGVDLGARSGTPPSIDFSALVADPSTLKVSGQVTVQVASAGRAADFGVTLFEDVDGDAAFNPEVDNTLGSAIARSGVSPQALQITASGTVRFAPGRLVLYIDSGNTLSENNEADNFIDLYGECQTSGKTFSPKAKWTLPTKVASLASVARLDDTNGDDVIDDNDIPNVVYMSGGTVYSVRGDNGQPRWSKGVGYGPRGMVLAVGDVDGDGIADIIAHAFDHKLVCLNRDGSVKWTTGELDRDPNWELYLTIGGGFIDYSYAGSPIIADLDNDGHPEVVSGRTVLNGADGSVKWVGAGSRGRAWDLSSDHLYWEFFPDQEQPVAVDLDGDGRLEVVAGNTAYRADGSILWNANLPDGYATPVTLPGRTTPSICHVANGKVTMLASDGTVIWGPLAVPGGALLGGAPTAFADGGTVYVGVAGDAQYTVLNAATGVQRWTRPTTRGSYSLNTALNSATYFNFDGRPALVYSSYDTFRIFDAANGNTIYEEAISGTPHSPGEAAVADVDGDGRADVVVPSTSSIKVLSDLTWNGAPSVFNEATYHVVNVTSDAAGTPVRETPTAFSRTHYRAQPYVTLPGANPLPDLTASYVRVNTDHYPADVKITARVGNIGRAAGLGPVAVAFFIVNGTTTTRLGIANSTGHLAAGAYEDVTYTWTAPVRGTYSFYAIADQNASGAGVIVECNDGNNTSPRASVQLTSDVALLPQSLIVSDPLPRPGDVILLGANAALSGAIDRTQLTAQFYLGDPTAGGTAISPVLPVNVTSMRGVLSAGVTFEWTVSGPSGANTIYCVYDPTNAIAEDDETNNRGAAPIEISTPEAIQKITTELTLTPRAAETGKPVAVDVLVRNIGNVRLDNLALRYSVSGGAGSGFSGTAVVASLAKFSYVSVRLGSFTASSNGNYTVSVSAVDPATTVIASPVSIRIAPFAGAELTALPLRVPVSLPLVQCHMKVSRLNTIVAPDDPLIPLIRMHIQMGVNWEQGNVKSYQSDTCFKCHIDTQTLAGVESARNVSGVTIDEPSELDLYRHMIQFQTAQGDFYGGSYPVTTSSLGAWALSSWKNPVEAQPYLVRSLNFIIQVQRADGSWQNDHDDSSRPSYASIEATTMMNMIALARGYEQTKDAKYLTSLTKAVNWGLRYDYASTRSRGVEYAARVAIGLAYAKPNIADTSLNTLIQSRIQDIAAFLRDTQNPDGSFGVQTQPDYPVVRTAQALYALALAGVPGSDPQLRNAMLWLINHQLPAGGWTEWRSNITSPVHWFDETTWAMIALPAAFQRLGQFDVDLSILLPASSQVTSFSIPPGTSRLLPNGTELIWRFPEVSEAGTDLYFNVKLNGLENNEVRSVTGAASLKYADPYTAEAQTKNISVPSVTGIAPFGIDVTTDKPAYGPSTVVSITERITNLGSTVSGITHDLAVRDANGTTVATVASAEPVTGLPPAAFPGWHYACPVNIPDATSAKVAIFPLNFAGLLTAAGANGVFDANSIRVSADASPSTELYFNYIPNETTDAAGQLYISLPDGDAASVPMHVYFDTVDNGLKPASLFSSRVSGAILGGSGLVGEWWQLDTSRTNPNSSSVDAIVPLGSPLVTNTVAPTTLVHPAGLPYDYWMTRWSGYLYVPVAGAYQFLIGSDDGSWLYIDDALAVANPGLHATSERSAAISLTQGFHKIRGTMFEWAGGESFYIKWAPPGAGFTPIPAANLFKTLPLSDGVAIGTPETLPNGTVTLTHTWNTGATAAAPYAANGSLRQNGAFVGAGNAPFSITPDYAFNATLSTDKAAYDAPDTVHVSGGIEYARGNTTVHDLTATLTITDAGAAVVKTTQVPIATITPGQIVPATLDWTVGAALPGSYTASLTLRDAQNALLVTRTVPFTVRSTSDTGRGVTGTITAPAVVNQGEVVNFDVTLTNGGNAALTNAPFAVYALDAAQNLVKEVPFTATIATGATQSVRVPMESRTLPAASYKAYLMSKLASPAAQLANTIFEVKVPPLKLEVSIGAPPRVLLWANCGTGHASRGCVPVPPAMLTRALSDAGMPYKIVGDEYTFLDEVRTGTYTAAVLYQPNAAEVRIAQEYLEDIADGMGLVLIKSRTDAVPKLDAAYGVTFRGNSNGPTPVELKPAPFTTAGQQILFSGDAVKIDLTTATAAGVVAGTTTPAIAYNAYAGANSVTIPFDTELTPTGDVKSLVVNAVRYVSRAASARVVARQIVPIDIKVTTPPGGPVNLAVGATLPAGAILIDASPRPTTTQPLLWNVTAEPDTTTHYYLWVRTPEQPATYTLTATAGFQGSAPIVTKDLSFEVVANRATVETNLSTQLSALRALATTNSDQRLVDDAQAQLAIVRTTTATDRTTIITVIDRILAITSDINSCSLEHAAARREADRLLVYWQSRLGN